MNTSQPVIELRKVGKIYNTGIPTPVLFDIDLRLMPGEFVAIVGSSGSGKTTLLNLMGLLDSPTSGEITLGGKMVSELTEEDRAMFRRDFLGFIFQFHYLLPEFNVLENALMPCRIKSKQAESGRREEMINLLTQVGLGDRLRHYPKELSGGQQQRVAIVRALANNPVLVLADEPTGNLDSKTGRIVFALMRELNRTTKKAFVIVTHDESYAREADRLVRIVDGRIVIDE